MYGTGAASGGAAMAGGMTLAAAGTGSPNLAVVAGAALLVILGILAIRRSRRHRPEQ
ncbi:hypothetical protein [Streptomyces sp. NPDC056492]|uniref:hypothetical protein n=1 Tax=unclassified Streptomyces TaxID=2593676 RepID=UPI00368934B5